MLEHDPEANPDELELWPENVESFALFLGLATQWRVDGMSGIWLGLDYPAVEAYLRMNGVADVRESFADLQVMELAALTAWNARRADTHRREKR